MDAPMSGATIFEFIKEGLRDPVGLRYNSPPASAAQ
jgi:hypothetical protein